MGSCSLKIIEVAIVGFQLLIVEVEAGEELIFLENVIADDGLIRTRTKIERAQLLEAANQKSELGLKGGAALAVVKRLQEWIFLGFDDTLRVQPLGQNPRQRALANSYGAFDCNVAGQLEEIGHGLFRNPLSQGRISGSGRTQLREEFTGSSFAARTDSRTIKATSERRLESHPCSPR